MPRLQHRNGVVVNVSAERAERLTADGWKSLEKPKPATARKSTKSDEK